jgi:hypothetical protein
LKASPFSLGSGDEVKVILKAYNVNGWSLYSEDSVDGALIEVTPSKMAPPTRDDLLTSTLRIVVDWVSLSAPENGFAEI